MEIYGMLAIILAVTFVVGYVNDRYFKLPQVIGLMFVCAVFSIAVTIANAFTQNSALASVKQFVASIDFNEALMVGMLGFLLFAGALHIKLEDLNEKKAEVSLFALLSTIVSILLVGHAVYWLLPLFGIEFSWGYCMLFGALISPTDPIAVISILKQVGASKSLETKIAGESLFNDGIGVVLFLGFWGTAVGGESFAIEHLGILFFTEVVGGAVTGFVLGYATYWLLKRINNFQLEIIGTVALVMCLYALANNLHMSGPIAAVVAGLLIGNQGRAFAMSENTRKRLDEFWELIDEILNAVLFVLVGLVLLTIDFTWTYLLIAIALLPIILGARLVSIAIPVGILRLFKRTFSQGVLKIMTWGGLRGGISLALVLSIPSGPEKSLFLFVTYFVVGFSIIVQGLTMKPLIQKYTTKEE